MSCTFFNLDKRAKEYILERAEYEKFFAGNISLSPGRGKAYTFLPEETEEHVLHQFERGGISWSSKPWEYLAIRIFDYVSSGDNICFIIPGAWQRKPYIMRNKHTYFCDDYEVYIISSSYSKVLIKEIIRKIEISGVGFFTTGDTMHCTFTEEREIPKSFLHEKMKQAILLFSSAYDDEAIIYWEL